MICYLNFFELSREVQISLTFSMVYIDKPNSTPLMGKSEKIAPLLTLATKSKILNRKNLKIHQMFRSENFKWIVYSLQHIHMQINQFGNSRIHILPRKIRRLSLFRLTVCIVMNLLHIDSNWINQDFNVLTNRSNVSAKARKISGRYDHAESVRQTGTELKEPMQKPSPQRFRIEWNDQIKW